jgi:hypothetical protein
METNTVQVTRVPLVWLAVPVPCERLIPFFRIAGSLKVLSAGVTSDRDLRHGLRKAAAEVDRGDF